MPKPNPERLADRALTPSYAGKTPKQITETVKNTEKNVRKLWEKTKTGEFQGSAETLQDAAETVVRNLDETGARIGKYIENAQGTV